MSEPDLRLDQRQSLSASWLLRLLGEAGYEFSQTSLSMDPFLIGPPDALHITVTGKDSSPWITAVSSDPSLQEVVDRLVQASGNWRPAIWCLKKTSVVVFGMRADSSANNSTWLTRCSSRVFKRECTWRPGLWVGGA